jgi:hypothetical protein
MERDGQRVQMACPYVFTSIELRDMGKKLAGMTSRIRQMEEDKKAEAAEFTATIRRLEQEIGELSYKIEQGCEERLADCRVHMDYNSGNVAYFREDTGELVTSRSMTPEERQTSLPVEPDEPEPEEAQGVPGGEPLEAEAEGTMP